jgi:type IV secretory pathway VirD2 relaxase
LFYRVPCSPWFALLRWSLVMSSRNENAFRVKPTAPKTRDRQFLSRVLREVSKAGGRAVKLGQSSVARTGARLGRGQVAAGISGRSLGAHSRRVVIKTRLVVLKQAGARSTQTHLRYIERDGVSREGERGQAYGPATDSADIKEFEERGRGDRHQFRFIVAPEDADLMDELRPYTRELMARMEGDLGTRLDWVAVDHWDTDNPHTHVVLRGKDQTGGDLVIARDYIAHGMRQRASELATEWLGPRTEREIRDSLSREVDQERWTSLDRQLKAQLQNGKIQFGEVPRDAASRHRRSLLVGRLQRLQSMGLADQAGPSRWALSPAHESTLKGLGERGDIVRTMQRALGGKPRDLAIPDTVAEVAPVIGRIAGKGLADELQERGYLVVDGIDGRAHYLRLPAGVDLADYPQGGIVEVRGGAEVRRVDQTIAAVSEDGLYRVEAHLARVRAVSPGRDAATDVNVHVRRLAALRRAGIVERLADGVWRVPADLPKQGRRYDIERGGDLVVELRSHLRIERQTRVLGATWLDQQLVTGAAVNVAHLGFGVEVQSALNERVNYLESQGLAERRGERLSLARNLLATLRGRDIEAAARVMQKETGLSHRAVSDGERVTGVYRRSVLLASGRFAMLDDGSGFSLVPWRPVIDQRLGQTMTAVARGGNASWEFGRQRGLSIG